MDMVLNLSHIPDEDDFLKANELFCQGGGKTATGMAACARLGAKAGVMAKLGGDHVGDFIVSDFQYNGVDTSRIVRGGPDTSSLLVITLSEEKDNRKIFISHPYTESIKSLTIDEVDFDYIASAKYLLLENGREASLAAAKFAKEHGVIVAVDGDGYSESMEQMLPWVDVFIGSEQYQQERFKDLSMKKSCEAVREMGPPVVWFTLGEKGCAGVGDGDFFELPSYNIKVRDTTGAGDVFHGAYLVAMMDNMPHHECAKFASAVSAIKCTYAGGRTGIPSKEVALRFMREGVIETKELDERLAYYRASSSKISYI